MPTGRESLQNETPTHVQLVKPMRSEMDPVIFLLNSDLKRRQETEKKSSWWAMPEYGGNDAAMTLASHCVQQGTIAHLG